MQTVRAIYPGTFDPITNGHIDIIQRAAGLVDRLVVAVAKNAGKGPLFSLEERAGLVRETVSRLKDGHKIEVQSFDCLLIHFAQKMGAKMIVRGLRAVSDFEYEFQMTGMNARLNPDIETLFLMASDRHQFISSRFVKEVAALGGEVSAFLPNHVADALKTRLNFNSGSDC